MSTDSLSHQDAIQLPLPGGGVATLRRVQPKDDSFLLEVYASTRADELAQVDWSDEQKHQFISWQYALQRREYDARFPSADYNLILVDDVPAGRVWVGRKEDEIRLLDIALLPQFQNLGVGTLLVRRLIDIASRDGVPLRHMVFVLNNNGRSFYERLGFVVIKELGAYNHMEWRPATCSS